MIDLTNHSNVNIEYTVDPVTSNVTLLFKTPAGTVLGDLMIEAVRARALFSVFGEMGRLLTKDGSAYTKCRADFDVRAGLVGVKFG